MREIFVDDRLPEVLPLSGNVINASQCMRLK